MFKNLSPQALGISGSDSGTIELALSNGFKGIDIDLDEFARQVASRGLAHAKRLIESARLKIGSFALPLSVGAEEREYKKGLESLTQQAELAQQIGCTRAVLTIDPSSPRPYHEAFEQARRRLDELGDLLAKHGMRLGVGFLAPQNARGDAPYGFVQTADALLLLVRMLAARNVGLAVDTWHWHLGGGTVDSLQGLDKDKLVTVTLSDVAEGTTAEAGADEHRRLPGETGIVDASALLAHLGRVGYDGPITPAASAAQFAGTPRDKIVRQAGAALDQAWKAAGLSPAGKPLAASSR